jgi:hypothetical protein
VCVTPDGIMLNTIIIKIREKWSIDRMWEFASRDCEAKYLSQDGRDSNEAHSALPLRHPVEIRAVLRLVT